MFSESEPVIVAGDQADEHHWLGAVFKQSMKRFECALAIAGEQMIAQFKIGQFARAADQFVNHLGRDACPVLAAAEASFSSSLKSVCTSVPTSRMISLNT